MGGKALLVVIAHGFLSGIQTKALLAVSELRTSAIGRIPRAATESGCSTTMAAAPMPRMSP